MAKTPDTSELVGKQINSVTVLANAGHVTRPNGKMRPVYLCVCGSCGGFLKVESQTLRSQTIKDCGCGHSDRLSVALTRPRETTPSQWKESSTYNHMLARCYDEKEAGYAEYGGRGIQVCQEWRESFFNFMRDMGERPDGFVLDREHPNGNYEPSNCRWINRSLSSFNTRKARNNTSGRTGVYWFKRVSKWTAAIMVNEVQIHLGYFVNKEDAITARLSAELKYFGENKIG